MKSVTTAGLAGSWLVAALFVVGVMLLCMTVGSTGTVDWPTGYVRGLRLDRALIAALAGGLLAVAGVGYQAVLRNPLAEPYLLGASGGAALAAFAWTLAPVAAALPLWALAVGQQGFAFIGAAAAVSLVLLLAGGKGTLEPTRAILVGVVVSIICGGLFALLAQLFREPTGGAMSFLFGRIPDPGRVEKWSLICSAALVFVSLAALGGRLTSVGLSTSESAAMGVSVNSTRWLAIGIASLAAAAATAVCGPIGFVGLMGPHLGRLFVGPDPRRLLPIAAAIGAALLCLADAAGRFGSQWIGTTIAAGIITNLLGGPFFLFLLYTRRGRVSE